MKKKKKSFTLQEQILKLGKQVLLLDAGISDLKAAMNVLRVYAATQLTPGQPLVGLTILQAVQKKLAETDPHAQESKKALDIADAIEAWKKRPDANPELSDS